MAALNKRLVANTLTVLTVGGVGAYAASTYFARNMSAFAETPGSEAQKIKVFGKGPAFKSLKLHSSENVNHNTKKLRFELPGGANAVSGLSLTSALLTFSKPDGCWLPVIRPYTPISKQETPGFIDLLVKKYPNGKASSHLHSLKPGESLFILASLPGFAWKPNMFSHVYLIAGGAGITPIYQLAQGILDNPADKTNVTVVVGVNTEEDLLMRREFEEYKKIYPGRLDVHYTVSRPGEAFKEGQGVRRGYVDKGVLAEVLKGSGPGSDQDAKVFVCGPPAMEEALTGKKGVLEQLGYGKGRVHRF
ncbi:hypothetical protein BDV18DRAFT_40721 [Aspergillus unguis]